MPGRAVACIRRVPAPGVGRHFSSGASSSRAALRIHLTMPDYSWYSNAIQDVSRMVYTELFKESAVYRECLAVADQADN